MLILFNEFDGDRDASPVTAFADDFSRLADGVESFETLFPGLGKTPRISAAARMQTWLRDRMSQPASFAGEEFRAWIHEEVLWFRKLLPADQPARR